MAPEAILKSPENLNPQVMSGPFMMSESVPGDHYTLVRNPRYYLASEGLPYLDKVVFRIVDQDTILKDLQAGSITSAWLLDVGQVQAYQRLTHYTLTHFSHQCQLRGDVLQLSQYGAGQPPGSAPGHGDGDRSAGVDSGGAPRLRQPALHRPSLGHASGL